MRTFSIEEIAALHNPSSCHDEYIYFVFIATSILLFLIQLERNPTALLLFGAVDLHVRLHSPMNALLLYSREQKKNTYLLTTHKINCKLLSSILNLSINNSCKDGKVLKMLPSSPWSSALFWIIYSFTFKVHIRFE